MQTRGGCCHSQKLPPDGVNRMAYRPSLPPCGALHLEADAVLCAVGAGDEPKVLQRERVHHEGPRACDADHAEADVQP